MVIPVHVHAMCIWVFFFLLGNLSHTQNVDLNNTPIYSSMSRTLHESVSLAPTTTPLAGGIPQMQHATVGNTLGGAPTSLRGGVVPSCQDGQNEITELVQPETIPPYTVQTDCQPGMVNPIGPPVLHSRIRTRPTGMNTAIQQTQMSPVTRQVVMRSPGSPMTHNMVPGRHQLIGGIYPNYDPCGMTSVQQPQMMGHVGHTSPGIGTSVRQPLGMPRTQNVAASGQQHMGGMRVMATSGVEQISPQVTTPNYNQYGMNTTIRQPQAMGYMIPNTAIRRPGGMPRMQNMVTSRQQYMGGMRVVNPGVVQNRPMGGINMPARQCQVQAGNRCVYTATPTLQMHHTVTNSTVRQSSALPSSSQVPQGGLGTSVMALSSQGKIYSCCYSVCIHNQPVTMFLATSPGTVSPWHILYRIQQYGCSFWCLQFNTRGSSEAALRFKVAGTDSATIDSVVEC